MSTDNNRPAEIEIRVDGRTATRFLAERFICHETAELLTFEASRWSPSICPLPPNPALPDLGVAATLAAADAAHLRISLPVNNIVGATIKSVDLENPERTPDR